MATWGAVNNTTVENSASGRRFSSGVWGAEDGTITDLHVYINGWAGAESSRWAIYTGGSAGDPTGATLVCDFGQVTTNISSTSAWYGMVADFGKTASGTITASSRVWIMCKLADCNIKMSNGDRGDLDSGSEGFTVESATTSVAFPSTWPTDAGTGGAEALKAYITYTVSGTEVSISATSSTGIQHWTGPLQLVGITKTLPILLGESRFEALSPSVAWGKQVDILLGQMNAEGFTPSIAKAVTILLGETRAQGFNPQHVSIIRTYLGLLGELRALGFTVSSEPAQTANIGIGYANFEGIAGTVSTVAPVTTITASALLRETQAVGFIGQVIKVVFPITGAVHFDGYGAQTLEFIKVISGPDIGEMRAEGIAATALIGQIRNYTISLGEVGFYALQQALTIQRTLDILVGQTNYTGIEPSLAIIRGGEINLGPAVGVVTLEGLINATANIQRTAFGDVGIANAEGFGPAAPAGQISVQSVLGEMYASGFVPLVSFNRYFAQLGQVYASGFAPDISYGLWRPIKRRLTTWASI